MKDLAFKIVIPALCILLLMPAAFGQMVANDSRKIMGPETAEKYRLLFNAGIDLVKSNSFREAADKFQEVSRGLPNFVPSKINYAICMKQLGRLSDAVWELEAAQRILPDDPDVLFNLGNVYLANGDRDHGIRLYERYIWLYPNDSMAAQIKATISSLREENQKKNIFADSKGKDNYLEECLSAGVSRWRIAQMPVPIFISDGASVRGYQPAFRQYVTDAFQEWSNAANQRVSFRYVDSPEKALITVIWTANKADMASQIEAGETQTSGTTGRLNSAKVLLLTVDNNGNTAVNLKGTSLHEIGHALGLTGHSSDPGDTMFMFTKSYDTKATLSSRDKRTVLMLYSLSSEEMNRIASRSVNHSLFESMSPSQQQEAAARFNDEGTLKFSTGFYAEAATAFEKAIAQAPGDKNYQSNAAKAYFKRGIQLIKAGDLLKAQKQFQSALKYLKNTSDSELLSATYQNLAYIARQANSNSEAKTYEALSAAARKGTGSAKSPSISK